MKMSVCDVCLSEGKLERVKWNLTLRNGFEKIKVQVCSAHEKAVKNYRHGLEVLSGANSHFIHGEASHGTR